MFGSQFPNSAFSCGQQCHQRRFTRRSLHERCPKCISIVVQRDATQSSLFIILQVHSTCFGCQPHPSSGVHETVTTAYSTGHIFCAATSLQRGQASLATLEMIEILIKLSLLHLVGCLDYCISLALCSIMVNIYSTRFNITNLCIFFPADCMYGLLIILKINRDCSPTWHSLIGLCTYCNSTIASYCFVFRLSLTLYNLNN